MESVKLALTPPDSLILPVGKEMVGLDVGGSVTGLDGDSDVGPAVGVELGEFEVGSETGGSGVAEVIGVDVGGSTTLVTVQRILFKRSSLQVADGVGSEVGVGGGVGSEDGADVTGGGEEVTGSGVDVGGSIMLVAVQRRPPRRPPPSQASDEVGTEVGVGGGVGSEDGVDVTGSVVGGTEVLGSDVGGTEVLGSDVGGTEVAASEVDVGGLVEVQRRPLRRLPRRPPPLQLSDDVDTEVDSVLDGDVESEVGVGVGVAVSGTLVDESLALIEVGSSREVVSGVPASVEEEVVVVPVGVVGSCGAAVDVEVLVSESVVAVVEVEELISESVVGGGVSDGGIGLGSAEGGSSLSPKPKEFAGSLKSAPGRLERLSLLWSLLDSARRT